MEKKFSLILDKEFIQYCELNNIEDVEKLARETFQRGFTLLKYGDKPEKPKMVAEKIIPVDPPLRPPPDMPKPNEKEDVTDTKPTDKVEVSTEQKNPVKSSRNDLYDE